MSERPNGNPESMQETPASTTTIVLEANEIVFQAARVVEREGTGIMYKSNLAKAAKRFMESGIIVRFKRK